jgi:hypothetical protein
LARAKPTHWHRQWLEQESKGILTVAGKNASIDEQLKKKMYKIREKENYQKSAVRNQFHDLNQQFSMLGLEQIHQKPIIVSNFRPKSRTFSQSICISTNFSYVFNFFVSVNYRNSKIRFLM